MLTFDLQTMSLIWSLPPMAEPEWTSLRVRPTRPTSCNPAGGGRQIIDDLGDVDALVVRNIQANLRRRVNRTSIVDSWTERSAHA
jgi:hypothetical protein